METAQLAELNQARHDQLHVDGGRVMTEVHQRPGPLAQLAGAVITGAPVVQDGGIERGLVDLVFDEQAPRLRHSLIDLPEALQIAVERAAEMELAREVAAISNPDRVRGRAERHPDPNAFNVVLDRLAAHMSVGMSEAAELVRQRLIRLILERIGVHRLHRQPAGLRERAQRCGVVRTVPRNVQGDARRHTHQLEHRFAVLELLENGARLAREPEAPEPRAAGSDAPRGHVDAEVHRLSDQRLGVYSASGELAAERMEVLVQRVATFLVVLLNVCVREHGTLD